MASFNVRLDGFDLSGTDLILLLGAHGLVVLDWDGLHARDEGRVGSDEFLVVGAHY